MARPAAELAVPPAYAPALARHLDEFPRAPLAGGTDVLYWVKENYAGRLVVHADHMVTWRDPARPDCASVAQTASRRHYLDGSLAVTTIVDAPGAAGAAADVVYVSRTRSDLIAGGLGGAVKRKVAQSQAEQAAQDTLGILRTALRKQEDRIGVRPPDVRRGFGNESCARRRRSSGAF